MFIALSYYLEDYAVSCLQILQKSLEHLRQPVENHGKTLEKPLHNHRKNCAPKTHRPTTSRSKPPGSLRISSKPLLAFPREQHRSLEVTGAS